MLRLYNSSFSGNCYKIRLLLNQLGITYKKIEVDIIKGESRTNEFLAKNPNGRVPLLEIADGQFLAESNAIIFYLSEGTQFLPQDRFLRAQVLQWMFFEQYSHEPFIATSRYWIAYLGKAEEYKEALAQKQQPGYAALAVMENHLQVHNFLVGGQYTIADISLFAYTHVAHEGNFDLTKFPAIQAWINRVGDRPQYIRIDE